MQSPARLLILFLLVAGIGTGVFFWLQESERPQLPPTDVGTEQPEQPVQPTQPVKPAQAEPVRVADPGRVEITTDPVENDADQGVTGRVLLPNGAPAADVEVFVIENANSDPLRIFLATKTGEAIEPVTRGYTRPDGTFHLGVDVFDKKFDLRVLSQEHPELQHTGFRLRKYEWYDTGDLRLELGSLVHGRVIDELNGAPIADATVYLSNADRMRQVMPTPGRERGQPTLTDASGFFRYRNAPAGGRITIGAEAPGYAFTELSNQELTKDGPTEFTLKLARGVPIAGVVVDGTGVPVPGAALRATAMSAKLPQVAEATSDQNGAFELPTLRAGAFRLDVTANGFEAKTEPAVIAGTLDLKVVLERQGVVKLRVLAADGRPVKVYKLGLKRYFPNTPGNVGKMADFPDIRISPANYEGEYANIFNIPHGQYVFQIEERNHAKTLSPPFVVGKGEEAPVVDMTLTMGAAIVGFVVDDRGQPVAGATVSTDLNGGLALGGGDFGALLRKFAPDTHTTQQTKTDVNGRFSLTRLAFAQYMVRVAHPDFCEGAQMDITLETEGEMRDLGSIQLLRGTRIGGTCTLAGRGAQQIRVTIAPPEGYRPETDANGKTSVPFSATAMTDSDGNYLFTQRVPPGTYRIYANREAGQNDIFGSLLDMRNTQRELLISPGQDQLRQDFNIPGQ